MVDGVVLRFVRLLRVPLYGTPRVLLHLLQPLLPAYLRHLPDVGPVVTHPLPDAVVLLRLLVGSVLQRTVHEGARHDCVGRAPPLVQDVVAGLRVV